MIIGTPSNKLKTNRFMLSVGVSPGKSKAPIALLTVSSYLKTSLLLEAPKALIDG